jgi:hypothetical protein
MARKPVSEAKEQHEPTPGTARERMAFSPSADLAERVRNYIYWTPGASLNQFIIEAVQKELERLEKELNKGKPWPPRSGRLQPGRPIS